jgi:hypothetical protein
MGRGKLNLLLMPIIIMPCVRVVMPKSWRMAEALLADGVVGLDFDAWGCTWLLWREFRDAFWDAWCTWVPIQMHAWEDEVSSLGAPDGMLGLKYGSESWDGWIDSTCASSMLWCGLLMPIVVTWVDLH